MSKVQHITVLGITPQADGRFTITYSDGTKTYSQPNAAFCLGGQRLHHPGDATYFELGFEIVDLDRNQPVEQT